MDILCLMGLFPHEYCDEIEKCSKSGMQNAANKLQWSIVKGLDEQPNTRVSIANSLYIGSYPKRYKKLFIPSFEFSHCEGACDQNIGFCNLTGLKSLSRYISSKKYVKKWAVAPSDDEKILLVYALTLPFAKVTAYIKKRYPNIKVCYVVPDLPDFMRPAAKRNWFFEYTLNKRNKALRKYTRRVDCFVLLTDAMKEWFRRPINYTVVEGIAGDINSNVESAKVEGAKKNIIYAGGISAQYGVLDMARAFAQINHPDWVLDVYGDGPSLGDLKEIADSCPNIHVHGRVPNSLVVEEQRKAALLINPRKNQIFTKYSFPSKILEYMSSGTPVLAYHLDGFPAEYSGYFYPIKEEENGMEKALRFVMSETEEARIAMGQKALRFVSDNKTPKKQCEKIVNMLRSSDEKF